MKQELDLVQEFHTLFDCYMQDTPTGSIPPEQWQVRARLMQEELDEYRQAAEAGDLTGVADALCDLLYVVLGTTLAHGLQEPAEELFREVHRSNLSKLDADGRPVYRADGKVLKSERFQPPRLAQILQKYPQPAT